MAMRRRRRRNKEIELLSEDDVGSTSLLQQSDEDDLSEDLSDSFESLDDDDISNKDDDEDDEFSTKGDDDDVTDDDDDVTDDENDLTDDDVIDHDDDVTKEEKKETRIEIYKSSSDVSDDEDQEDEVEKLKEEDVEEEKEAEEEEVEEKIKEEEEEDKATFIPKQGLFYQHDSRSEKRNHSVRARPRREKDKGRWLHDRYDQEEQTPKTRFDIIQEYGYDIRASPKHQIRGRRANRRSRGTSRYHRNQRSSEAVTSQTDDAEMTSHNAPRRHFDSFQRSPPPRMRKQTSRDFRPLSSRRQRGGFHNKSRDLNRASPPRHHQQHHHHRERTYHNSNMREVGGDDVTDDVYFWEEESLKPPAVTSLQKSKSELSKDDVIEQLDNLQLNDNNNDVITEQSTPPSDGNRRRRGAGRKGLATENTTSKRYSSIRTQRTAEVTSSPHAVTATSSMTSLVENTVLKESTSEAETSNLPTTSSTIQLPDVIAVPSSYDVTTTNTNDRLTSWNGSGVMTSSSANQPMTCYDVSGGMYTHVFPTYPFTHQQLPSNQQQLVQHQTAGSTGEPIAPSPLLLGNEDRRALDGNRPPSMTTFGMGLKIKPVDKLNYPRPFNPTGYITSNLPAHYSPNMPPPSGHVIDLNQPPSGNPPQIQQAIQIQPHQGLQYGGVTYYTHPPLGGATQPPFINHHINNNQTARSYVSIRDPRTSEIFR